MSFEPLASIENLQLMGSGCDDRAAFGLGVGRDLYNYIMSFQQPPETPQGWMMLPHNILDRWLESLRAKFKADPNFVLKVVD